MDFIELAAAILIFCLAITILLHSDREINIAITATKNDITAKEILYEQPLDQLEEGLTPYKEVIGIMQGELDYTVVINGIIYDSSSHNPDNFDFSTIVKGEYKKSYAYHDSGKIEKIVYNIIN